MIPQTPEMTLNTNKMLVEALLMAQAQPQINQVQSPDLNSMLLSLFLKLN